MKCTVLICDSVVLVLLLLTVTARCQLLPDDHDLQVLNIKTALKNSFEEALVNSKESLYQLQQVYFNPSQSSSPMKVCLDVTVTVQDIIVPNAKVCGGESYEDPPGPWPAFKLCNDDPLYCLDCAYYGPWYLKSRCELKLANDQSSDSSQLSSVLTTSGSTGVFYAFDPSFYNIMKALSTSIDISFPYYFDVTQNHAEVNIRINRSLEQMPCTSDAIDALKLVLVWVSQYQIACSNDTLV